MSLKRNTLYNLAGAVLPFAVSIVVIPVFLRLIGEDRYGVLALVWLVLGYFGVFDLGLGRATAQRIASQRHESIDRQTETYRTALLVNLALGVLGGLVLWPAADYIFGNVVNIDGRFREEILAALPFMALAVPIATVSAVLNGAMQGRERFLELNIVALIGAVGFQLLPLVVATWFSTHLMWLVLAVVLTRCATMLLLLWRCQKMFVTAAGVAFASEQAKALLRFGGWVTLSSIISPLMLMMDRMLIGAVTGAKAVAHYAVPYQLAERTTILPEALNAALFPQMASLEESDARKIASESLLTLAFLMTPLMAAAIFAVETFLRVWIGQPFSEAASDIARVLLVAFWVNGLARVPYALLQATGRPRLTAMCHLSEVLPYLFILYVSVTTFGPVGAAVALGVRVLTDFVLLTYFSGCLRVVWHRLLPSFLLLVWLLVLCSEDLGQALPLWTRVLWLLVFAVWMIKSVPPPVHDWLKDRIT